MSKDIFCLLLFPYHGTDFIACFKCLSKCLKPNVTSDTNNLTLSVRSHDEKVLRN